MQIPDRAFRPVRDDTGGGGVVPGPRAAASESRDLGGAEFFPPESKEILEQDAESTYIVRTQAGLIGHRLVIASAKGW